MSPVRVKSSPPVIVVAGDVCIDWLSIPTESMVAEPDAKLMNWQLRDGRHMYAVHGGTWLAAAFTKEAVGNSATVVGQKPEPHPENVPPDDIIHSMLMLGPCDRERDNKKEPKWVVTHFEGFAGPDDDKSSKVTGVERAVPDASIVLLDDAGNGFRNRKKVWPVALNKSQPLVLYKVRRPLCKGALWRRLRKAHLPRTIVLLGADELRGEGGSISRGLSWERSSTDLVLTLDREPGFKGLRDCPLIIITLGIEAALLVRCTSGRVSGARLYYLPNLTEGGLLSGDRGNMSGFGSAFAARIAAALVSSATRKVGAQTDAIERALRKGVPKALALMDRLLEHAFGPCRIAGKTAPRPPEYPIKEIFKESNSGLLKVCEVALPVLPKREAKELTRFRSWRILDSRRDELFLAVKHLARYEPQPKDTSRWLFSDLAAEVVKHGVAKVFANVPIGRFKKLVTLDRSEIESYRSIENLIKEFLNIPRPERPLCLAVFGPPGGGKSFGVTQVAKSLDEKGRIEPLTFNVSQWGSEKYLVNALHRVRDSAISEKVPLVFFDEFDSQFQGQRLGWLKYFLAPMQDGVFADGLYTHTIGKAIFVFAGGTAATYAEFRKAADVETRSPLGTARLHQAMTRGDKHDDLKSAKLPDFDSRLRGHVDVFGLDPPTDTNLLRRALVLRGNIEKSHKNLIDAAGNVKMSEGVLRAFLQVPSYYHGARSLEAILDMSHLIGCNHFDPSLLPPQHQLDLHVNGTAFMALVQHLPPLAPVINEIAMRIHELYFDSEADKDDQGKPIAGKPESSLQPWDKLIDTYKWSSREQAAYYPTLLAAAGCSFEPGERDKDFKFSDDEIKRLAQMEHDRWTEERRIKQPEHPDRVPWEELDREEQDKDIRTIKKIPEFLGKVKLRVVRL